MEVPTARKHPASFLPRPCTIYVRQSRFSSGHVFVLHLADQAQLAGISGVVMRASAMAACAEDLLENFRQ